MKTYINKVISGQPNKENIKEVNEELAKGWTIKYPPIIYEGQSHKYEGQSYTTMVWILEKWIIDNNEK